MRLLFLFVDGVGLGPDQSENPFYYRPTPGLSGILGGKKLTANALNYHGKKATLLGIDATLGVDGLPQSATGQASIFTGINAPAYVGAHLNGFPNQALRRLLAGQGMFRRLKKEGFKVTFANAYRPQFFAMLDKGLPGNYYSCSTLVTYYGDLPFYSLDDMLSGRALYMDITNEMLGNMGFDLPQITPEEGARRLLKISGAFDFCLFEYFLSDLVGHTGDCAQAERVVDTLDRFIGELAARLDPEESLLVVSSDHGNLEDLSINDHTFNPVPALLVGSEHLREKLAPALQDLTDLLPFINKALSWKGG